MNTEARRILDEIQQETDCFRKAKLIHKLNRDYEVPIKKIAELLHLKSSYVCHIIRLNRLPEIIIDGYYAKLITLSHLFIISRLKDKKKMADLYEKILSESLTVLQTDYRVREILHGVVTEGQYLTKDDRAFIAAAIAGSRKDIGVTLIQSRIKSKLVIEVKGNLEKTSKTLRTIVNRIVGESAS